jgi:phosphohistidine phosphatase SixA
MWTPLNRSGRQERALELLLRLGVAGCFIGHGAFGLVGKHAWLPYFAIMGIGEDAAWRLMPLVGAVDVAVGIVVLLSPRPAALAYAAVWATWTALLRPLSGENPLETLERAGNYGVPIAFLILAATRLEWGSHWLRSAYVDRMSTERRALVASVLRATTVALLLGHGGLALLGKPLLATHLEAIGLSARSLAVVGAIDVALALAVALRPMEHLLLGVVGWKLATELLYPVSGAPLWEVVERSGSYVAPLALWTIVRATAAAPLGATARARGPLLGTLGVLLAGLAPAGLALAGPAAAVAAAAQAEAPPAAHTTLLTRLRAGGYVLACRHAITDRSGPSALRVDFDGTRQRVLTPGGEEQARRIGQILRRLGVPIGDVLTSPYARTAESARLTFGRSERNDALYGSPGANRDARRVLFSEPPRAGTNRALMTHQGVLYGTMPGVPRGSIREGDCVVVLPRGEEGFDVVARLGPDEWEALGGDGGASPSDGTGGSDDGPGDSLLSERLPSGQERSPVARVIAAVQQGGTTLVCRHAMTAPANEVEPVDYDDPSTQRLLSAEGERQSEAMGRAMTGLGIVVTEIVASPMQRARRTAELMFGRPVTLEAIWHTNGGSYRGPPLEARRRSLARTVERGTRLIVSHIGTIASVLPAAEGRLEEGDCAVVRAEGERHRLLGIVPWRAWARGRLNL